MNTNDLIVALREHAQSQKVREELLGLLNKLITAFEEQLPAEGQGPWRAAVEATRIEARSWGEIIRLTVLVKGLMACTGMEPPEELMAQTQQSLVSTLQSLAE